MSRTRLGILSLLLLAAAGFVVLWSASVARAATGSLIAPLPTATINGIQPPRPAILSTPVAPTAASLESPSATCFRPVADPGICYLQWDYIYMVADTSAYA